MLVECGVAAQHASVERGGAVQPAKDGTFSCGAAQQSWKRKCPEIAVKKTKYPLADSRAHKMQYVSPEKH